MKPKLANKRYTLTMLGASFGYMVTMLAVAIAHDHIVDGSLGAIALTLTPGIFVLIMIASVWRYLREIDEVARHDYTQSMLIGLYAILVLSGSWGAVELFNEKTQRVPIFYIFPLFFMIFGVVHSFTYGRKC